MTPTKPTWRPPRITPAGISFAGLAPRGHLVVGVLGTDDLQAVTASQTGRVLMSSLVRRADAVLLAEVLDVGPNCPGVEVGDQVVIQRFSGAAGIDPGHLMADGGELDRFSALQVVRCGNGIRAQDGGNDEKLVGVALMVAGLRALVKSDRGRTVDDPKMIQPRRDLLMAEALLAEILRRRAGRCVNGAVLAAGLQTGDDDAVFDGVIAVVERAA